MEVTYLYERAGLRIFASVLCILGIASSFGDRLIAEEDESASEGFVRAYEPIYVGYTFDDDDQAFLDFSLSVMMPIGILNPFDSEDPEDKFPNSSSYVAPKSYVPRLYIAFNGRAGQYIGTRESSPVVGKRFNPLLAARWWQASESKRGLDDYFEVSYGHESNGQRLGSLIPPKNPEDAVDWGARFLALEEEYRMADGDAGNARDEISRGWDYVGARWAKSWKRESGKMFLYLDAKYFLGRGLLQEYREDYYDWENDAFWLDEFDGEILRSKVDGLTANIRYRAGDRKFKEMSLELKTGYTDPLKRITYKFELGFRYFTLWYRNGYNSDFANYYHKDKSFGIALKIRSF